MPLYEHVFLARQDISQAQVEALTKEYTTVIEEGGGKVGKTEYWGVKTIAFKIKKNRKAHYSLLNIEAPHAAVAEMERRMGLSTDVIRFLTVSVDEHETEPSAQMRKSDRDDRRDGERGVAHVAVLDVLLGRQHAPDGLALNGKGDPCAPVVEHFSNRPANRVLVEHASNQSGFTRKIEQTAQRIM